MLNFSCSCTKLTTCILSVCVTVLTGRRTFPSNFFRNSKNPLIESELRALSVTQSVMSRRFPKSTCQITQLCSCFISSALFYSSLTETTDCRPLNQTLNLFFGPALNLICCHSDCLCNPLSHIRTAL